MIKKINERKQVGIIYHFTGGRMKNYIDRFNELYEKINDMITNGFKTYEYNYISFTRNFNLKTPSNKYSWGFIRFTIDGTKLSDNYKVEPYVDAESNITRASGEAEERVIVGTNKYLHINKYIISIDLLVEDGRYLDDVIDVVYKLKKKHGNIKFNVVSKFLPSKLQSKEALIEV